MLAALIDRLRSHRVLNDTSPSPHSSFGSSREHGPTNGIPKASRRNGQTCPSTGTDERGSLEGSGQPGPRPANASARDLIAAQAMSPPYEREVMSEHGVKAAAAALQEEIDLTLEHRVFLTEAETTDLIDALREHRDDPRCARLASQLQIILNRPQEFESR